MSITINITSDKKALKPTVVPFQVGGGQVSFGCGDSAHPAVTYIVPNGARDVTARGGVAEHRSCQGADAVCDGRRADGDRERNDYGAGPELGGEVSGEWPGRAGAEGNVHDRSGEGAGAGGQYGGGFYRCREGGDVCRFRGWRDRALPVAGLWSLRCAGEIASATVPLNSKVGVEKAKFDGPIKATWAKGKLTVSVE